MPRFAIPPVPSWKRPDDEVAQVIAGYLALSRSPLRATEPEWFALAEQAEWERVVAAAGIRGGREPSERAGVPGAGGP